jgi:hypothetical protein
MVGRVGRVGVGDLRRAFASSNRRAMMRGILCGAAVVGVGLALPLGAAALFLADSLKHIDQISQTTA